MWKDELLQLSKLLKMSRKLFFPIPFFLLPFLLHFKKIPYERTLLLGYYSVDSTKCMSLKSTNGVIQYSVQFVSFSLLVWHHPWSTVNKSHQEQLKRMKKKINVFNLAIIDTIVLCNISLTTEINISVLYCIKPCKYYNNQYNILFEIAKTFTLNFN